MRVLLVHGDLRSGKSARELEKILGGESAITVATVQLATQMCIELLGSRTHLIPVVMPVTADPTTLSAVMRAGAQPILVDINGGSLQMDHEALKTVLEEVVSAAVILTRPGGAPVDAQLLELVQDVPTIVDARVLPPPEPDLERDLCGTFNIFDLTQMAGTGAVIRHKYKAQQDMLRHMRDGVMGHDGALPELVAEQALLAYENDVGPGMRLIDRYSSRCKDYSRVVNSLKEALHKYAEKGIVAWPESPTGPTLEYVFVPNNAKRVVAQLRSHEIEAIQPVFPLHLLDEVRQRYKEPPSYPVAEKVMNQVIAIPVGWQLGHQIERVAKIIGEVSV